MRLVLAVLLFSPLLPLAAAEQSSPDGSRVDQMLVMSDAAGDAPSSPDLQALFVREAHLISPPQSNCHGAITFFVESEGWVLWLRVVVDEWPGGRATDVRVSVGRGPDILAALVTVDGQGKVTSDAAVAARVGPNFVDVAFHPLAAWEPGDEVEVHQVQLGPGAQTGVWSDFMPDEPDAVPYVLRGPYSAFLRFADSMKEVYEPRAGSGIELLIDIELDASAWPQDLWARWPDFPKTGCEPQGARIVGARPGQHTLRTLLSFDVDDGPEFPFRVEVASGAGAFIERQLTVRPVYDLEGSEEVRFGWLNKGVLPAETGVRLWFHIEARNATDSPPDDWLGFAVHRLDGSHIETGRETERRPGPVHDITLAPLQPGHYWLTLFFVSDGPTPSERFRMEVVDGEEASASELIGLGPSPGRGWEPRDGPGKPDPWGLALAACLVFVITGVASYQRFKPR